LNRKIPIAKPLFDIEEEIAIKEVMKSGILASGPKTKTFESEFAQYIGVKHAIGVTNGTVALDVALKALNIGPGDEVITSAFSFIASANCILFQNAKPVFADIDPKTFNIDPSDVNEKISSKTKAIIPIHLFGQPADMAPIKKIAEDNRISLIEDAAQAHGAEYKGQKVGSIGDIGCFSFYATKNMTTGEGGIITTDDQNLDKRLRLLINHGQSQKYYHETLGYNYRMNEIAAAIGLIQLKKLDKFNDDRRFNAKLLTHRLNKLNGLEVPYIAKNAKPVFHQYVIRVEDGYPLDRDSLKIFLTKKCIGTTIHYPIPIYKQLLYQNLGYQQIKCHYSEDTCKHVLSLPVHPSVDEKEIEYIIESLTEIS
jgi:perosamine synthetase